MNCGKFSIFRLCMKLQSNLLESLLVQMLSCQLLYKILLYAGGVQLAILVLTTVFSCIVVCLPFIVIAFSYEDDDGYEGTCVKNL